MVKRKFPEANTSLDNVEHASAITLPDNIRWLLTIYGYWHGTGIFNMEESISATKLTREHSQPPTHFVILYDHHDAGIILLGTKPDLSTKNYRIIDSAWESVPKNLEKEKTYPNIKAYVESAIETEADFFGEQEIGHTE